MSITAFDLPLQPNTAKESILIPQAITLDTPKNG